MHASLRRRHQRHELRRLVPCSTASPQPDCILISFTVTSAAAYAPKVVEQLSQRLVCSFSGIDMMDAGALCEGEWHGTRCRDIRHTSLLG